MGINKIVLITTGQPSTNPRIVKEADAFAAAGFEVTVLYSYYIDWATDSDKELLEKVKWNYRMIGGTPYENKSRYLFTKFRFRLSRLFNKYAGNKRILAERAQARAYDELLQAAKRIKADWYIGHNLGALAIAANAAKYNSAKVGFDFEDYHRGESNHFAAAELKRINYLEEKYVPQLNYISAASPIIAQKIEDHFPDRRNQIVTLLNCFPLSQQPAFRQKSEDDHSLQLFWFSQTIGFNRGLEIVISAMNQLNDPNIHLTLVGRCNQDFKEYLKINAPKLKGNIHFPGIISPDELPSFAAKFDVGLALELPIPENRNICLTNKVFTYLLAGNAIIFSETRMQKEFCNEYTIGQLFKEKDIESLLSVLKRYKDSRELTVQRDYNYHLAGTKFNWGDESQKLLNCLSNG